MEKIKLKNELEFEIPTCGILELESESLEIRILPKSKKLEELETIFSTAEKVSKIYLVSDTDEVLRVFTGYTSMKEMTLEKNVQIGTIDVPILGEETTIEDKDSAEETRPEIRYTQEPLYGDMVKIILCKDSLTSKITDLESQLTDTQLALTEVYEMIGGGQ